MVGQSNTSSFADASLSTVSLTASADNVNKALKFEVTGLPTINVYWYGKLEYVKIVY